MTAETTEPPTIESRLPDYTRKNLVVASPSMQAVYRDIEKAAGVISNVLILGESGTGKDSVAQAIHNNSSRRYKKIVRVDMAALPRDLLEAELFGYCKGAFTHAMKDRLGRFLYAQGSTLFLNEIGEIDTTLQAKLLSAIEYKEVTRLGEDDAKPIDVRIIAATNRDINQEMREGKFRSDLFYRVAVLTIQIPPLRERMEDIPYLIAFFMQNLQQSLDTRALPFTPHEYEAYQKGYDWPGNVRELSNVVERVIATGEDKISILEKMKQQAISIYGNRNYSYGNTTIKAGTLFEAEKNIILNELRRCGSNVSLVADKLGINRRTLVAKLREIFTREDVLRALDQSGGDKYAAANLLGVKKQTFDALARRHSVKIPL